MGWLCGATVMYLLNLRTIARETLRADAAEARGPKGDSNV